MAVQAEQAFVKSFLSTLSGQTINFPDDYQQSPDNSLKRVPVLPIPVPAPPQRRKLNAEATSSAPISVTFKLSKSSATYKLSVLPTDTISSIKTQLASLDRAPPADIQRLLYKGKALADAKLLKEYNIGDGETINLMLKPGVNWDPSASTTSSHAPPSVSSAPPPPPANMSATLNPDPKIPAASKKHQRIPSVVLSPSSSADGTAVAEKPVNITLNLDETPSPTGDALSTYHEVLANPDFWLRLRTFIGSEFSTDADRKQAFEEFLLVSKGCLTAHEIARIRDVVGITGMAGH